MRQARLQVKPYQRPPLHGSIFAVNLNREGLIRLWEGEGDIQYDTDKGFRQAVLNVHEERREIRYSYAASVSYWQIREHTDQALRALIRRQCPLVIPRAKVSVAFDLPTVPREEEASYRRVQVPTVATILAPADTSSLLMGFDETRQFIAGLPKEVKSVEEAHEVLKPAEVKGRTDWKRQGEFFFLPVRSKTLYRSLTRSSMHARFGPLETYSSHRALRIALAAYPRIVYVTGPVVDVRRNHHEGLMLEGWHKVVRNRELRVEALPSRRRTWD
jgi:hypothetical protein